MSPPLDDFDNLPLVWALLGLLPADKSQMLSREEDIQFGRLESPVVFVGGGREFDALPLADQRLQFGVVLEADVVADEVSVEREPASLLLAEQQI